MMDLLQTVISFIVAIGVLVTIHEFGHFWVARRLGVKVLRFSVGFGKPLLKKTAKDGTEYVLAAIPLGGYVRMLGEQDDEITEQNRHQAFNHKPLSHKAAIVFAGPFLNFIFAIAAFWLMYTVGVPGQVAMTGPIEPNSAADRAGMQANERITHVFAQETPTWNRVNEALLDAALDAGSITIQTITDSGRLNRYDLIIEDSSLLLDDRGVIRNLGIQPWRPPVWIGKVLANSPAEQAGFQRGDRVISADGKIIQNWSEWVEIISTQPETAIPVTIEREGGTLALEVIPKKEIVDGKAVGKIGVGGYIPDEVRQQHLTEVQLNPLSAIAYSIEKTWDMSILMLRMLGKMLIGEASHKNISGPITIAQYAGITAELGWLEYVRFLALISISLGVLNLLPIPMLDGGHLFYYVLESVRGKPLSDEAMATGQQMGMTLLMLLMGLALYNDFSRLFG